MWADSEDGPQMLGSLHSEILGQCLRWRRWGGACAQHLALPWKTTCEGISGDTGEKLQMTHTHCKSGQTSQQDSKDGHDLHLLCLL